MLFNLINEANFFVVFIALIIVFFLLGIIIGNIFNRPKNPPEESASILEKDPKENTQNKDLTKVSKEKPQKTDTLGQEDQEKADSQKSEQNQQPANSKYKYYNWW